MNFLHNELNWVGVRKKNGLEWVRCHGLAHGCSPMMSQTVVRRVASDVTVNEDGSCWQMSNAMVNFSAVGDELQSAALVL
jgi:hypothetical protein